MIEAQDLLVGSMCLFACQIFSMYFTGFGELTSPTKAVHFLSIAFIAITVLLFAHVTLSTVARQNEMKDGGYESRESTKLLIALALLAFGISADIYVAARAITDSIALSITLAAIMLALYYGLWFAAPLFFKRRGGSQRQE